jgi:hypothetical protein
MVLIIEDILVFNDDFYDKHRNIDDYSKIIYNLIRKSPIIE